MQSAERLSPGRSVCRRGSAMSVHVMSWVLRHSEEKLGSRLTLLVLADHAHDDGTESWAAVDTIAREARLSRRQVQTCLQKLEESKAIIQTGTRSNGTRIWRVNMPAVGGEETASHSEAGGAVSDIEGCSPPQA